MIKISPYKNFINNAKLMHNNRYDYKYVEYIDGKTEVVILCNKCNESFEMIPNIHVDGKGCKICYDVKTVKRTTEEFIENSRKIHGDKYDYSLSKYINIDVKVVIICNTHGKFEQSPDKHIGSRHGCPICGKEKISNWIKTNKKKTTKEFIKDAQELHGNLYDYSLVNYINNRTKITIICKKHGKFEQSPSHHVNSKYGCFICSGKKLKTTEEFIKDARKIHDDLYDYSLVKYVTNKSKIIIICKIHGKFEQIPSNHLRGNGCYECGIIRTDKYVKENLVSNTDEFIHKTYSIHGTKYNYELVEYKNSHSKIIIICEKHGKFEQTPNNHLRGYGCSECGGSCLKSTEEFIKDAIQIHDDLYDYSLTDYTNNRTKVIIICKIHGKFEQSPISHLSGGGCPDCGGSKLKTIDEFIENARKIHGDRYNYSLVDYVNNRVKITIICKKHGKFEQAPTYHTDKKQGCPICAKAGYSQKAIRWLKEMEIEHNTEIQHAENGGEMKIDLIRWGLKSDIYQSHFLLDGFDSMNLVCYEFNGCLWHGHSCIGNPDDINPVSNKTFQELYEKTMEKERLIKLLKFKLVSIWECEYDLKK